MHIAIFVDQHPHTTGGAQVSVRLQRKYLEKLGHRVTICTPSSHNKRYDEKLVICPSFPLAGGGEYHLTVPTKRVEEHIDRAFNKLPPVDVVHVQGDYWGAILGLSFAKRHNIPVMITFHNNLGVGIYKIMGRHLGRLFIYVMATAAEKALKTKFVGNKADPWNYLHNLALHAQKLVSPTHHFSDTLMSHGVAPEIGALSNGIDDELLRSIKKGPKNDPPVIVWAGRMSREKRLLEYLQAIRKANVPAKFKIYGNGDMLESLRNAIRRYKMGSRVSLGGKVPLKKVLQIYANADAMAQTSVGFETQGMTVFEAISLGTPVIMSDPLIAQDFPKNTYWLAKDSSVDALAAAIRQAYGDIVGGKQKPFKLSEEYDYRQSTLTKRAVRIYKELTGRGFRSK